MVKEIYDGYRKKYKLPPFDELDDEFELSFIETPDFFLRQVKKKIKEKMQDLAETFATILNPNTDSLVQLYECKLFTSQEKDDLYELFKHVHYYIASLHESEYDNNEKRDAELINEIFKEWKNIKIQAFVYLKKLREHWKEEINLKEALEYLG